MAGLTAEQRKKRKKRKKILKIAIPVGILVILAGLVVGIQIVNRYNEKLEQEKLAAQTTAAPKGTELVKLTADDLEEIIIISADNPTGEEKTFKRVGEDRTWVWAPNEKLVLGRTLINGLVTNIAGLSSIDTISDDKSGNSEVYGLKNPAHIVRFTTTEGNTYEVRVGSKSPSGDYYFMAIQGDEHIYMMSSTLYSYIKRDVADYIAVDPFPELSADQMDRLEIQKRGETESIVGVYSPKELLQVDRMALSLWYFPSSISGRYDSMDYEKGNSLNEALMGLSFSGCVRAMPSDADLEAFGLKDPAAQIKITYKVYGTEVGEDGELSYEREEIELLVGNEVEINSMNYYYAQVSGHTPVIKILKSGGLDFLMNSFVKENMMNLLPCQISISCVDRITVAMGGKKYDFEIKRETTTDENGKETTTERFYGDGKEFDDSSFRAFYTVLVSLSANQYLAPEKVKKDADVILDYEFFTNYDEDETKHIRLLAYDDNFCQLEINGEILYLVDRSQRVKIESDINTVFSALE
ncbi:MAG: DUF4340 domain-containing protein [Lachnospiraceae bacterium]|nr:DUF4340 domain-containing protein [Lachnospiraceae bacterium]